jgi:hypothetical protein
VPVHGLPAVPQQSSLVSISSVTALRAGTSTLLTSACHWMSLMVVPWASMKDSVSPSLIPFQVPGAALMLNANCSENDPGVDGHKL